MLNMVLPHDAACPWYGRGEACIATRSSEHRSYKASDASLATEMDRQLWKKRVSM